MIAQQQPTERDAATDQVAVHLLPRASLLTRMLLQRGRPAISRAEAGVLTSLLDGPQRVTELAAAQALAQPTVTQLVDRLVERGLVVRERDPQDGRAVLVSATTAGHEEVERFRAQYRALLRDHLATRSDAEVLALAAATEVLADVIAAVQAGTAR